MDIIGLSSLTGLAFRLHNCYSTDYGLDAQGKDVVPSRSSFAVHALLCAQASRSRHWDRSTATSSANVDYLSKSMVAVTE